MAVPPPITSHALKAKPAALKAKPVALKLPEAAAASAAAAAAGSGIREGPGGNQGAWGGLPPGGIEAAAAGRPRGVVAYAVTITRDGPCVPRPVI
jgi:hypothetical protein